MRLSLFIGQRFCKAMTSNSSSSTGSSGADVAVQGTNDDAAISKLSACTAGYYVDPFLQHFIAPNHRTKRAPLINRGYYARIAAVSSVIQSFLDAHPPATTATATATAALPAAASTVAATATASSSSLPTGKERAQCQIIGLGAGFDTTYFRLTAAGKAPYKCKCTHARVSSLLSTPSPDVDPVF